MGESNTETTEESILYEVLEFLVRKQEPELTKYKNDFVAFPTPGTIKNALRYLNNRYSLPETISQQISYTLPWKFAIGDKGRILAILQENIIEIRKSKDEYSSIVGKASVPKDVFPQWRKLAWSPDGSMLVLASSNGYLSFYNSFGNNIFNISPKSISQNPDILEAGDATASIIFKRPRVETDNWDYEFIRVTYSGLLKSYCVSLSGFSENHEFSFGNFYRNGVNSVSYSEKHNLFFVAGNSANQSITCTASQIGLTCWRTLNDHPYYKLSVASQDIELNKSQFSIWNFIPVIKNRAQSIIFKTSISPSHQFISCLHTDGTISIWSLPSLKLQKQWKLSEQPNFNALNPLKNMKTFKKSLLNISEYQPLDIGWWSDNAVIIARYSGAISVCSTMTLKNLLGSSPEFLYNHPQIAELAKPKGFLCLDCEVHVTSVKRNRESTGEGHGSEVSSDSEIDEEDDLKSDTILNYTTNLMQSALYSITDIEKFQPKRKKSKIFHRSYRLLGIKKTTPEELYSRKIEIEEYEEALILANTYNLDPDLVYQTQWRKSEFSINAIQEHLSKVSKRSWVLNECVSRVPESLEATRELLKFGLRGANLETLIALSINDDGKFKPAEDDDFNQEESTQLQKLRKINQILESIDKDKLSEQQKELINYRKKLLNHLDKLQTYEVLLKSQNKFDKNFYEEFRKLTPLENAVKFAKSANYQGVEIMFTYYGSKLMPHWLTIVSFFPETLNPEEYKKLLPECDIEGRLFLLYEQELRPKDWVERITFSNIDREINDDTDFIYENRKSLLAYRNKEYTQDLLRKWYKDRAYEIEHDSCLVDNALALINIGKSHNINGLESLLFELETLDDLVYKVGLEELSLTQLEKLNDLEKIKMLMIKSDETTFVNNIKTLLLPYIRRRNRYTKETLEKDLLYEYLVDLSSFSLTLSVKFFELLKSSYDPEILDIVENVPLLALDCIYACSDTEIYNKAKIIFDSTISYSSGKEDINNKYKELEKELNCLQIMNRYNVKITLNKLNISRQDYSGAKILLEQMSENLIKLYPFPNEKNWSMLLNDMIDIQEQIFACLDIETCFEICMVARLKSRSISSIQGCINLMEMKKTGRSHLKVSYERAIDFILQASIEYFNNSKSLTHLDMELAKECLHLITDDDERIKEEYDLIESLQILNEFNISILPLQVRSMQERIKLIEDCLNSLKDAYKHKQKLLNLSNYLHIEKKNKRLREGKTLNLIAMKAFEMKDFIFCSSTVQQMIKNNYQASWNIAMNLAFCDDYDDMKFRWKCIWFAINNGPSEMIENLMKRANLLQIQILNADLCKWMPVEDEYLHENENSGSDVVDNFITPLTENKEFVPKLVQTSAELVKSSAQVVKQSTFDLIKNAGNKDFWKSKLNFNFIESEQQEIIENDEAVGKNNAEELQNFFCFYETLQENCGISKLESKYSQYSQNIHNIKLKLCQTLLRISLLSETASYGVEVSDINHLLLECTEHTITEDCLMGLNYMLNLNDTHLTQVKDFFKSLPQIKLYRQILAYFYSIKLYLKIYPESKKVFSYDPIELIECMSRVKSLNSDEEKHLKDEINDLIKNKQEYSNNVHEEQENINKAQSKQENKKKEIKNIVNEPNFETEKELTLEYIPSSEEVAEWDNWGDEWTDMVDSINVDQKPDDINSVSSNAVDNAFLEVNDRLVEATDNNVLSTVSDNELSEDTNNVLSDEQYQEIFEKELSNVQNLRDYNKVKEMLLKRPSLIAADDFNSNVAIKLIISLTELCSTISNNDFILEEIKDLLTKDIISTKIITNFIREKEDVLTPEQLICLQLQSKDIELQEEAIGFIKRNYKSLNLNAAILEEIFFNNLTASFDVSHDLYYRIIEEVFLNRSLKEIENNVRLLIKHLIEQKNIPHAIALLNQLEGIPSSLSTYENCFELLLRKSYKYL